MVRERIRVFAQGRGPGPKNVGVEYPDGKREVITYRSYKHTMAEYASAAGFIQFDPKEREANGQKVVDATIKTLGTDGVLIRVTIWPELQGTPVKKGDFLAADGKFTVGSYTDSNGTPRQSLQISASALAVLPGVDRADREVVNSGPDPDTPIF